MLYGCMQVSRKIKKLVIAGSFATAALLYGVLFQFGILPPYRESAIHIAVVGPMTGEGAGLGEAILKGIKLSLDQINRQGGVNGKKIKLLLFDDQNDEELARLRATDAAMNENVVLVLGHAFSSTSIIGGQVYKQFHVPAISATATAPDVTMGNEWYFRTIFTNDRQAVILANFTAKVLKEDAATIIFDEPLYGKTLVDAFKTEAGDLRLDIKHTFGYDPTTGGFEGKLSEIVDQLISLIDAGEDLGVIFLAVQPEQGVPLVKSIRDGGVKNRIIGSAGIGFQSFADSFSAFPAEQEKPGYYTDGIYAASPMIFDVANQKAQDFRSDFMDIHGREPSWVSASGYDAATIAVRAIRETRVGGMPQTLKEDRTKIRDYLAGLNTPEQAFQGVTGYIYFDENGDAIKSVPMGLFQRRKFISAPVQFEPVNNLNNIVNLDQAIRDGEVILAGGTYMNRAVVVYTGLEINKIRDIDLRNSTYWVDFYLWFRSNSPFSAETVEFENSGIKLKPSDLVAETAGDGLVYKAYRLNGEFDVSFRLDDYPFDQQTLDIRFLSPGLTRERLIFVRDDLGMKPSQTLLDDFRRRKVLEGTAWTIDKVDFFQDTVENDSSLGDPAFFDATRAKEFSRFNAVVQIKRDIVSYSVKNLTPVLILIGLAYLLFFLPTDQIGVRIGIGVNVILATAFFSVRLANDLPNIGYLVAIEYIFFGLYALALYGIFAAIVSYVELQAEGQGAQKWANRLVLGGKLCYTVIVLGGTVFLILWYLT